MGRSRKPPNQILISASTMILPKLLEEIDQAARRTRHNRSQFLRLIIEKGWKAFLEDGQLFDPETDWNAKK